MTMTSVDARALDHQLLDAIAAARAAGHPWGWIVGDLYLHPLPYRGEVLTVEEVADFRGRMGV